MIRILAISIAIALCFSRNIFSTDPEPQRALIDGAKKEGKMVFYTSVETEFARALTTAFEAKYSFIKTDVFRSTHDKIVSRMTIERKAGTYATDTISVGEFET